MRGPDGQTRRVVLDADGNPFAKSPAEAEAPAKIDFGTPGGAPGYDAPGSDMPPADSPMPDGT